MRKTKKYVAALMAAVMTASSSVAMFTNADEATPDTSISLPSNASTQADALRFMLENYITQNNIDAWLYDKESSPDGIIFIGYYRKNENIPLEIITQVEKNGFDPQLVNFVQEDHEKDGLIEDLETIKRLIDYYISANKVNARVVSNLEMLDDLDKNVLYVEYTAEKSDIPDRLAAYIKERKIDPDLVKTGVLGSFSKQTEQKTACTFDEFRKLTEDDIIALFKEKGLEENKVWTTEKMSYQLKIGRIELLLQPNPFPVSIPELEEDYKVCWEQERFGAELGLPEELFTFKQNAPVNAGFNDGEINEYCSCTISPKAGNSEDELKLMTAAMNYVQLNPYFVNFHYDYLGSGMNNPTATTTMTTSSNTTTTVTTTVTKVQTTDFSFQDIKIMSVEEVKALFAEKGMNDSIKYRIWTKDEVAQMQKNGRVFILLQANPFPVANEELADDYKVSWEDAKLAEELGLPTDLFAIKQMPSVTIKDEKVECCACLINPKTNEATELMAAALNYVQLDKYFVQFHYDYLGSDMNPTEKYSFEEFSKLDKNEIEDIFAKNIPSKKSVIWTEEKLASELKLGRINALIKPDDNITEITNKQLLANLGLPDEFFDIRQLPSTKVGIDNGQGEIVYEELWKCNITLKTNENMKLLASAMNYIQLNPSFVQFDYDYLGSGDTTKEYPKGDANCDGTTDMSDVVLIMQALANPNKYGENGTAEVHLTAQGKENADMDGNGLTVGDAQAIQTMLLGIE